MNSDQPADPTAPDRTGCPPDDKVRAFASGQLSDDEELRQHILTCPFCGPEYRDHQRDLANQRFIKLSTRASYVVILGVVISLALRSCH